MIIVLKEKDIMVKIERITMLQDKIKEYLENNSTTIMLVGRVAKDIAEIAEKEYGKRIYKKSYNRNL